MPLLEQLLAIALCHAVHELPVILRTICIQDTPRTMLNAVIISSDITTIDYTFTLLILVLIGIFQTFVFDASLLPFS